MATIKDVAREAGVSTATVSRVLNGYTRVSAEVRQKVLAAAQMLDYQPHVGAKGLVQGRTNLVGVLVPDMADEFFALLARSVVDVAAQYDYGALVNNTDWDSSREREALLRFRRHQVEGYIVLPKSPEEEHWNTIYSSMSPVVTLDRRGTNASSVVTDHVRGMQLAVTHLVDLGCGRIGYVGFPGDTKMQGFLTGMEMAGLEPDCSIIVDLTHIPRASRGRHVVDALFSFSQRPPDAIICTSDNCAIEVLAAMRSRGIRVPEDVAVVGYNNSRASTVVSPQLTTIAQPTYELGRRATEMLVTQMQRPADRRVVEHVTLEPRIVVRGSTVKSRSEITELRQ